MIQSVLARHMIYPLNEHLLKRQTFRCKAELEHSQWLSRDRMEQLQDKKLTELLRAAYQHCLWHREQLMAASIDPASRTSLANLRY